MRRRGVFEESKLFADLPTQLAAEYSSAAARLIEVGQAWAAALVICCGIDAVAGFYAGRSGYGTVAGDFMAFVSRYMPVFSARVPDAVETARFIQPSHEQTQLRGRLAWAAAPERRMGDFAEILYRGYRCGLIHQGTTAPGMSVVDIAASTVFVFEREGLDGEVVYKMSLNVRPFCDEFVRAVGAYARDLGEAPGLMERFLTRWESVAEPQWTVVAT